MKYALIQLTSALLIAGAIAGGLVMAKGAMDKMAQAQVYQACATAYHLEYNDAEHNTVVISPNTDEVKKCIEELNK